MEDMVGMTTGMTLLALRRFAASAVCCCYNNKKVRESRASCATKRTIPHISTISSISLELNDEATPHPE